MADGLMACNLVQGWAMVLSRNGLAGCGLCYTSMFAAVLAVLAVSFVGDCRAWCVCARAFVLLCSRVLYGASVQFCKCKNLGCRAGWGAT